MTTEEGNKLIAEFMGFKIWYQGMVPFAEVEREKSTRINEWAKYHSSWDWLMPVVEKIEGCFDNAIQVIIKDRRCTIELDTQMSLIMPEDFHVPECYSGTKDTKIHAVYNSVIQFIQWHNEYKSTQQ